MSLKGDLARAGIVTDATKNTAATLVRAGNVVVPPKSGLTKNLPVTFDPLAFTDLFDDFFAFDESQGAQLGYWITTNIAAGLDTGYPAVSSSPGPNGNLLLVTAGASGDGIAMPYSGTPILLASGRQFWFMTRVLWPTSTVLPLRIGVGASSSNPFTADPNGIYFNFSETQGKIGTLVKNGSGTNETADHGTDLVADTYYEVGFYYDGSQVQFYLDRDEIGDPVTTFIPVGLTLTNFMSVRATAAANQAVAIDYVRSITPRV